MTNIQGKKKSPMVGPFDEEEKKSASWDDNIIEYLIDVVMEQVNQGERNGNKLARAGWRAAKAKFRSISALYYDVLQIKNK